MPRTYPRAERVERLAREVLGEALQGLTDPRIGFATVTSVKMSPDLRQAKVYVSVLGTGQAHDEALVAIRHAVPHLRAELGREVRLKFLPQLEIVEDTTAAYGQRIEQLLREAGVSKPPVVAPVVAPVGDAVGDAAGEPAGDPAANEEDGDD